MGAVSKAIRKVRGQRDPEALVTEPTKASEVLSNALVFWGEHGEYWVRGTIGSINHGMCFVGGIQAGAGMLHSHSDLNVIRSEAARKAYKKAEKFIFDELEEQGLGESIIGFNDVLTKSGALHRRWQMQSNGSSAKERLGAFLKRTKKGLSDRNGYHYVKAIACGALKRALDAEEQEETREEAKRASRSRAARAS